MDSTALRQLFLPAPGVPAAALKTLRSSLQETLEDDASQRGSASRLALVLGTLTLCVALSGALGAYLCGVQVDKDLLTTLVWALAGGGGGPYTIKRVMEAWRGPAASNAEPPASEPKEQPK